MERSSQVSAIPSHPSPPQIRGDAFQTKDQVSFVKGVDARARAREGERERHRSHLISSLSIESNLRAHMKERRAHACVVAGGDEMKERGKREGGKERGGKERKI